MPLFIISTISMSCVGLYPIFSLGNIYFDHVVLLPLSYSVDPAKVRIKPHPPLPLNLLIVTSVNPKKEATCFAGTRNNKSR